jgi:hypothetical protein
MARLLDLLQGATVDETELLHCRMLVIGLDIDAWIRSEPVMLSDLKRTCVACSTRPQCGQDLISHFDDPNWPDWRDYCPNAAHLNMLSALQGFLASSLTIEKAVERLANHPQSASIATD